MLRAAIFASVFAVTPALSAADFGIDGVAAEFGAGDEDSLRGGAALQWDWNVKWFQSGSWFLGGYTELSASYWHADDTAAGSNDSLGDFGITPVFRWQRDPLAGGIAPYLEGAIGAHVLTETEFGDRNLGTNFSFGDHLGAGLRFGARGQYDVGYRFQHLSNAGLGDDNEGVNFHLLRAGYHF